MSSAPYEQAVIGPREGLREQDATRIVLHPIASPLPLAFLGLVVGSLLNGQRAVSGRLPEQVQTLGREAGVREQL